ncbi:MAG TPA: NnrU family protein [Steroidobacteraceae bacterium]|nr:NnrU family protein [Steroidobacteraceae bacterium]
MTTLVLGLCVFFGMHSIAIVAPDWRDRMRGRLGERTWKGLYALISLAGLVLIVHGFALTRAAPVVLYTPPPWMRHVTFLLMLPVFPLLIAAYLPGRIKAASKHPMLAAVKFWAFAHLLMNGRLADVLLFGGFLAWAVADRISLKRRPAALALRTAPPGRWNDAIAIVVGLALYVFFVGWAHRWLFGVSPLG